MHEQRCTCQAGPFPAGLVLHSWMGSAEMTKQLARIEGVYFSISGHTLGLSDEKLGLMLQQASRAEPKASAHDHYHVDKDASLTLDRVSCAICQGCTLQRAGGAP